MNEDQDFQTQSPEAGAIPAGTDLTAETPSDLDAASEDDRVFDISPDLNISQVEGEGTAAAARPAAAPRELGQQRRPNALADSLKSNGTSLKKQIEEALDEELASSEPLTPPVPRPAPAPTPAPAPAPVPTPAPAPAPVQEFKKPEPFQSAAEAVPASFSFSNLMPSAKIETAPVPAPLSPIPSSAPQSAPTAPRPVASIPLQDLSMPLAKAKVAPANAPIKTVHTSFSHTEETPIKQGQSLQDAVAPELVQTQGANAPKPASQNPNLKPIRTYESDVAEALSHKKTSTAAMVIAENKQTKGIESIGSTSEGGEAQQPSGTSQAGTKLLVTLASLVLVAGGLLGAYYLYSISPLAPAPASSEPRTVASSLIPADSQVLISVDGLLPIDIENRIQSELAGPQNPGTIRELVFTRATSGQVARVAGPSMLSLMDIDAPDILVRSLTAPWMLGIYADPLGNKTVFTVATTNFFQNAFAGMLQWENLMADDLRRYVSDLPVQGIYSAQTTETAPASIASTTATSTEVVAPVSDAPVQQYFTLQGKFEDRIVKNKDVRIFKTSAGQTLFLYSFIDSSTLVFAKNAETLTEILERLEKQAFVR